MVLWSSAWKDATRPDGWLLAATAAALDGLVPPRCAGCGGRVNNPGELCGPCFRGLRHIVDPCCEGCGLPFESALAAGSTRRCEACRVRPGPLHRVRAMLLYDDGARRLILPFKHQGMVAISRILAPGMAQAGQALLAEADVIVPIPLHRRRLFQRGYNQSALLASELGRLCRMTVVPDALWRTRATPSLDARSAAEREAILAGAIAVRAGRDMAVRGRAVLLVDDVMTSGATLRAAATAVLAAGAIRVDALVAARVPPPGPPRSS